MGYCARLEGRIVTGVIIDVNTSSQVSDKPQPDERSLPPLKVSDRLIKKLSSVFKLLADKSRLKIVLALMEHDRLNVTALCRLLKHTQPAVSHHLTLMRNVGLVDYDRAGKHNYYYLASEHMRDLFEQFFAQAGKGEQSLELETFVLTFARR
jgi:DNA-binding transcriptional ArsR family regulator